MRNGGKDRQTERENFAGNVCLADLKVSHRQGRNQTKIKNVKNREYRNRFARPKGNGRTPPPSPFFNEKNSNSIIQIVPCHACGLHGPLALDPSKRYRPGSRGARKEEKAGQLQRLVRPETHTTCEISKNSVFPPEKKVPPPDNRWLPQSWSANLALRTTAPIRLVDSIGASTATDSTRGSSSCSSSSSCSHMIPFIGKKLLQALPLLLGSPSLLRVLDKIEAGMMP